MSLRDCRAQKHAHVSEADGALSDTQHNGTQAYLQAMRTLGLSKLQPLRTWKFLGHHGQVCSVVCCEKV